MDGRFSVLPVLPWPQANFVVKCDDVSVFKIFYEKVECRNAGINYIIEIGLRDLERAIVNGINHAGYPLKYQGYARDYNAPEL